MRKTVENNTEDTVIAVLKKAKELHLNNVVVASNSGRTAERFLDSGLQVVCVTRQFGYKKPGECDLNLDKKMQLMQKGVQVLTTTHLFAGLDRAVRLKYGGLYPAEIVANTLRILGQGIKVCVEISVMALDAGLIPYGKDIIAVAGSLKGADTACVIVPAHSNNFFDTVIKEIIRMPREK